CNGRCG
nr:Chain B, tumor-homing peptide [synthetic construct]